MDKSNILCITRGGVVISIFCTEPNLTASVIDIDDLVEAGQNVDMIIDEKTKDMTEIY